MPAIYLFEDSQVDRLYPLTYARPAFLLRCGARTLLERFQRIIGGRLAGVLVRDGLAEITRRHTSLPVNPGLSTKEGVILVNGRWLMLAAEEWSEPAADTAMLAANAIVSVHLSPEKAAGIDFGKLLEPRTLEAVLPTLNRQTAQAILINRPWDLLEHQRGALLTDWPSFGRALESAPHAACHILAPENVHISRNVALAPGVVLDAQAGPIIIDEGTEIRPNAVLTGPLYVGPHCVIRTAADIREDCSFGPSSRVGGEVIASIILGHSNKQHHGFLGHSILGEWVNLGAGTTTSNLKNTYGIVRSPLNGVEESTGRHFLGSIIGDHAKLGIGTYLSTGAVIGFASQITASRPAKFIPSFAWVTPKGIARVDFERLVALARTVMSRRHVEFTPADHDLFVRIAGDWSTLEEFDWSAVR